MTEGEVGPRDPEQNPEEIKNPEKPSVGPTFDPDKGITKSDWKSIDKELGDLYEANDDIKEDDRLEGPDLSERWGAFLEMGVAIKILNPGYNLNLDQTAWQGMRLKLEEFRENKEWRGFVRLAMAMKILAAEKVEVTGKGLEITMPEKK